MFNRELVISQQKFAARRTESEREMEVFQMESHSSERDEILALLQGVGRGTTSCSSGAEDGARGRRI